MEEKKIDSLKAYHKNPRKITGKMFDLLGDTIKEFGDLSGIVVNVRDGELVGGNQRTAFFKQNADDCQIVIETRLLKPTEVGSVAYGYVSYKGEKFNYREVDWDPAKASRANIVANKVGGFWDNDILANEFDIEELKLAGFEDFELGFTKDKIEVDDNRDLTTTMDSYLDGNIKQIVLYFSNEAYQLVIPKLETLMQDFGVESHTEVFEKLIEFYENHRD